MGGQARADGRVAPRAAQRATSAAAAAAAAAANPFAAMMAMGAMGQMGAQMPAPAAWMQGYHQFMQQMAAAGAAHQQAQAARPPMPPPPAGVTFPPPPQLPGLHPRRVSRRSQRVWQLHERRDGQARGRKARDGCEEGGLRHRGHRVNRRSLAPHRRHASLPPPEPRDDSCASLESPAASAGVNDPTAYIQVELRLNPRGESSRRISRLSFGPRSCAAAPGRTEGAGLLSRRVPRRAAPVLCSHTTHPVPPLSHIRMDVSILLAF